jgi:hypothetical protein
MTIEVFYFDGCPHFRATVNLLKKVLEEHGRSLPIIEISVVNDRAAKQFRFLGSPTVRINSVDIEPSARSRSDFGIMCRTYDGSGGVPSEYLIRNAIEEAASG